MQIRDIRDLCVVKKKKKEKKVPKINNKAWRGAEVTQKSEIEKHNNKT